MYVRDILKIAFSFLALAALPFPALSADAPVATAHANAEDLQLFLGATSDTNAASLNGNSIGSLSTLSIAGGQEFTSAISRHQGKTHRFNDHAGTSETFFGEAEDPRLQHRIETVMDAVSRQFGLGDGVMDALPQFWSGDYHRTGKVGSRHGIDSYSYQLDGFAGGVDFSFGEHWLGGIAGGYSRATSNYDALNQTSTAIDAYQTGIYATYNLDRLAIDTNFSFNMFDNSSKRSVLGVNAASPFANASGKGYQAAWQVTATANGEVDGFLFTPMAGVSMAMTHRGGMTENGAGIYDLSSGADTSRSLKPMMGLDVARQYRVGGHTLLTPEVYGIYHFEMMDRDEKARTRLDQMDSVALSPSTTHLSRHSMQLGTSFAAKIGDSFTGKILFDSDLQPTRQSFTAGLRVSYVW